MSSSLFNDTMNNSPEVIAATRVSQIATRLRADCGEDRLGDKNEHIRLWNRIAEIAVSMAQDLERSP